MQAYITSLLRELDALLVAHYYQKDEIVALADICGDSLELARKASQSDKRVIVFCGVAFMGQSVKVLAPTKRVIMPKLACCSLAKMIDEESFSASLARIERAGVDRESLFPIVYINSSASVKALVGELGGSVCTSSNAQKIFQHALSLKKKILFLPDRCLGSNLARANGLRSCVLSSASDCDIQESQVLCFDGFCSVHQLFTREDITRYKNTYKDILIISHPECDPSVVEASDFVGSTSAIISFVESLPHNQAVAIATEANLVRRLRRNSDNTFILSQATPECPTMNETTLPDLARVLESFAQNKSDLFKSMNEVIIPHDVAKGAKLALDKMLELSV